MLLPILLGSAALAALAALLALLVVRLSDRILVPEPYGLKPEFEILGAREAPADADADASAAAHRTRPDGRTGTWAGPATHLVRLPRQPEHPSQFARTEAEGRYGLRWKGGAGRLGPVIAREGEAVVRPLEVVQGRPPRAGDPARLDHVVFHGDPGDRGLDFEETRIPGPVGPLPAWWLPGEGTDAILVLHGRRRADRTEALRILPALRATGASVLVASYRNHDASPPAPDGFYHYGATEVRDARAALDRLTAEGAERVLLVGFSMGGALALELAKAWPDRGPAPIGAILDSPLLDPPTVFARVARRSGAPGAGLASRLATAAAGARAGIDWASLDQRRTAEEVSFPVLLIGGTTDDTVPIGLVDAFAARLPASSTYLRLEGVQHVEGWNAAPERYERAVAAFLDRTGVGTRRAARPLRRVPRSG